MAPGGLWFPPLVETLIATSIVYMALENIVGANVTRRWIITFAFGLVPGVWLFVRPARFAAICRIAHTDLAVILQRRRRARTTRGLAVIVQCSMRRSGIIVAGHMRRDHPVRDRGPHWHWMTERGAQLLQFPFPEIDAPMVLTMVRWAMALVAAAALIWIAGCCGGVVMKDAI